MSYTIKKSDGSILLTLGVGKIDQITTSLTLIGKNIEPYGEYYNNSLVNLLENFASDHEPRNPMVGQLWFNTVANKLYVYDIYNHFVLISGGGGGGSPTALPTRTGTMYGYTPSVTNGSVILGFCAGNTTMTGFGNIAMGIGSLASNVSGTDNIAQGYNALNNNSSGSTNIVFGHYGAACNTVGNNNFAAGYGAMNCNMSGDSNIAIGKYAMYGYGAGNNACPTRYNRNATGNVAMGECALYNITYGINNVAVGCNALGCNKYGCNNVAIGYCSNYKNVYGCGNIGIGCCTIAQNQYGSNNIAIGDKANASGDWWRCNNISIGYCSLYYGGSEAVAIGGCASAKSYAQGVVAIGFEAALNNQSPGNVAIGLYALRCNTYGSSNVAIGSNALSSTHYGSDYNTAVGHCALAYNPLSCKNTAIGAYSQPGAFTNCCNTSVGSYSLYCNRGGCNTAFGTYAGYCNNYGNNNIYIGNNVQGSTCNANNEINLGNGYNNVIRAAVTTITSLSDCRDKTNIAGIPVGLDFIKEVRPVQFTWNTRDGTKTGKDELGFIAQELDALQQKYNVKDSLGLVYDSNPDKLEATPGKLLPVLVKAVQDLAVEQDAINAKMVSMQAQIDALLAR